MPTRLVIGSIRVARGTKTVSVPNPNGTGMIEAERANVVAPRIGETFDFTQAEIDYLNENAPGSIRMPRNEDVDNASTVTLPADVGTPEAPAADVKKADKKADANDL
jgi:hypothetical protein